MAKFCDLAETHRMTRVMNPKVELVRMGIGASCSLVSVIIIKTQKWVVVIHLVGPWLTVNH